MGAVAKGGNAASDHRRAVRGGQRRPAASEDSPSLHCGEASSSSTCPARLLYPSSHGNSLYSPISALPTSFSTFRKGHRKRNSAREKVPKLSSHCNVIKPLGGFYPPAQSCLKEPAAIKEMFNSLHIPKQEPRATCGSCVLKFSWWNFPVGSKVKTLHSQCSGQRCDPWWGELRSCMLHGVTKK